MAEGIRTRHSRSCTSRAGATCNCKPSYEAHVWLERERVKKRKTFRRQAEAKSWRVDALKAAKDGKLARPNRVTVRKSAERWLEQAKRGEALTRSGQPYKPGVIREWERSLRLHVFPAIGAVRLESLRRRDVQDLVDTLVGKELSGSTVRNVVMPLRVICRRAIEDDELTVNPTAHLRLPAAAGTRDRVATADEAERLVGAVPAGDRALWATAFYAGLRRGELRALRWDDVDDAKHVIHVRHGWDSVEGEIGPKSEKSVRDVPLAAALRLILLEHKAATGRRGRDLVFGRSPSNPFTPGVVTKRACDAWNARYICGCETVEDEPLCDDHAKGRHRPITLHECRHTYVSLMHDAGFSLERIGDYIGHSSTYITDRYRHLLEGHEKEAADILDAYLSSKRGAQTGAQSVRPASLSAN